MTKLQEIKSGIVVKATAGERRMMLISYTLWTLGTIALLAALMPIITWLFTPGCMCDQLF